MVAAPCKLIARRVNRVNTDTRRVVVHPRRPDDQCCERTVLGHNGRTRDGRLVRIREAASGSPLPERRSPCSSHCRGSPLTAAPPKVAGVVEQIAELHRVPRRWRYRIITSELDGPHDSVGHKIDLEC